MFETILFDLDGTISDSGEGIIKSVQYAMAALGLPPEAPEALRCFVGPPLLDTFMGHCGLSEAEARQAIAKYRERYSVTGITEHSLYPGMDTLLRRLKAAGKRLAVASSKPQEFVERILADCFACIVGSGMDGSLPTKAAVVAESLRRLGVTEAEKPRCVMVGDRKYDVEGAAALNIACIGADFGYAEPGELQAAGAAWVVASAAELEALLLDGEGE